MLTNSIKMTIVVLVINYFFSSDICLAETSVIDIELFRYLS